MTYIREGSVRDGYHLWAERFDRLVDDIFDLQKNCNQTKMENTNAKVCY